MSGRDWELPPFARDWEWPKFNKRQIEFLRTMFPPRCKLPNEDLETHLRYAGMVHLVELISMNGAPADEDVGLADTVETVEDALNIVDLAIAANRTQEQQ